MASPLLHCSKKRVWFACICVVIASVLYLLNYHGRFVTIFCLSQSGLKEEILNSLRPKNYIFENKTINITNRKHFLHGGVALHEFEFLIENSHLCWSENKLDFLIYIYTAPREFEARARIRETLGKAGILKTTVHRIAFICGRSDNLDTMLSLIKENNVHHDVILIDYVDTYSSLTHKGVMTLKWLNLHCSNARFYVKVDADIILNIFMLKTTIDEYLANAKQSFLCHIWEKNEVIRKTSRFQVLINQYPRKYFPRYCNGATWIFTADLLAPLYMATFRVPFINVEDVYTSGLLPENVGHVKHLGCPEIEFTWPKQAKLTRYTSRDRALPLASEPENGVFREAWAAILDRLTK